MKTKVVEFVVQDCPIMGKVIHRHYIDVRIRQGRKSRFKLAHKKI